LVLLTPVGLVRTYHVEFKNKLLYDTGILSESMVEEVVRKRLQSGQLPFKPKEPVGSEVAAHRKQEDAAKAPALSVNRPDIQFKNFVVSFGFLAHQAQWLID